MKKLFRLRMLFRGDSELSVVLGLGVASLFAVALGGLFYTPEKSQTPIPGSIQSDAYLCCDSGNGDACKASQSNVIGYNSDTYGLLKSNIYIWETVKHLVPTNIVTPHGRIFLNNINVDAGKDLKGQTVDSCVDGQNRDFIAGKGYNQNLDHYPCQSIENDLIIYVCKSGSPTCDQPVHEEWTVSFDAYARTTIGKNNTIPDSIKSCDGPVASAADASSAKQKIVLPTNSTKNSLQIGTFSIEAQAPVRAYYLSPYCKPAIYLYPASTTSVHVMLAPQGKLSLTIPQYPLEGWNVTAKPNGDIFSNGQLFDYLYYEAKLSDQKIIPPSDGFVVAYADLQTRLPQIVTAYGLNTKEKDQFVEYWMKVLPQSPYYFIGIMPENELDTLSPLNISPTPDHIRRVTLYFQALEKPISVSAPAPFATFTRSGFSVVEWGGIFKKDPKHPFSCFM